jgi:ABC-type nitrate/sulfonate/bicarbonate transport system substrate-binding protein
MLFDGELKLSRRNLFKASAAVGAGLLAPSVFAQSAHSIRFTLPWLAQGATAYVYVAEDQGMFKRRGIKAEISRGYGSLASGQAIANKQFDFGLVSASSTILCAANGLPLMALGTTNYEAYLGVLVREDSPIKTPADLMGKRMGGVPASVEFPLWRAFAKRSGIDAGGVEIVQADPRVLERTLVEKQIDASWCVTSSSYAVAKGMGVDTRAILMKDYSLPFYSNNIVTRPEMVRSDPELCRGVTEAILEALAFAARDPDAAMGILLKSVPELALSKGGKENVRLSQGFMLASVPSPESIEHALGYSDMARVGEMTDLIMEYAAPATAKRPDLNSLFTNEFVGSVKLNEAEWKALRARTDEFPALLKGRVA